MSKNKKMNLNSVQTIDNAKLQPDSIVTAYVLRFDPKLILHIADQLAKLTMEGKQLISVDIIEGPTVIAEVISLGVRTRKFIIGGNIKDGKAGSV